LRASAGNLNYLGLDIAPAKSTVGDALRNRPAELFQQFFFKLLSYFESDLSVSRKVNRKANISFEQFSALDSCTISLFTDILKGVGHKSKGDGKKKGGLKVHMLTDIHADAPRFANITEARQSDVKFLGLLKLPAGSMVVFDRAYNVYEQYWKWTESGVNFVGRLKKDAKYVVQGEALFEKELKADEHGVFKVEHIHIEFKKRVEYEHPLVKGGTIPQTKSLSLRLVHYRDENGRIYEFITNNWDISPEEVALCYKYRWTIETMFKKLKQNFQLTYFYSETENGIKTQIWCTLIAHLLLRIVQIRSESNKAFSTIAALIRMHLISHLSLVWVVTEGRKAYPKSINRRNKSQTSDKVLIPLV
jgi:hypothetical protein